MFLSLILQLINVLSHDKVQILRIHQVIGTKQLDMLNSFDRHECHVETQQKVSNEEKECSSNFNLRK